VLALVLLRALGTILAGKNALTVLINLQLDHLHLGRVDGDVDSGTVCLLALDALHMDAPLAAVHLHHLAGLASIVATGDGDLILLPHRDAAHMVLLAQLLAQGRTQENAADVGGSSEVRLARLAAAGGGIRELHLC